MCLARQLVVHPCRSSPALILVEHLSFSFFFSNRKSQLKNQLTSQNPGTHLFPLKRKKNPKQNTWIPALFPPQKPREPWLHLIGKLYNTRAISRFNSAGNKRTVISGECLLGRASVGSAEDQPLAAPPPSSAKPWNENLHSLSGAAALRA